MAELFDLMLTPPPWTLAVAESMSCGHLQSQIGAISGASRFFKGGLTTYTLEGKVALLGVDRRDAEPVNCVSKSIALQMAAGACQLFSADIGLATTGYAESSPVLGILVPFVWWALAQRLPGGRVEHLTGRVEFPGASRLEAQENAANVVLTALVNHLRIIRQPGVFALN